MSAWRKTPKNADCHMSAFPAGSVFDRMNTRMRYPEKIPTNSAINSHRNAKKYGWMREKERQPHQQINTVGFHGLSRCRLHYYCSVRHWNRTAEKTVHRLGPAQYRHATQLQIITIKRRKLIAGQWIVNRLAHIASVQRARTSSQNVPENSTGYRMCGGKKIPDPGAA